MEVRRIDISDIILLFTNSGIKQHLKKHCFCFIFQSSFYFVVCRTYDTYTEDVHNTEMTSKNLQTNGGLFGEVVLP